MTTIALDIPAIRALFPQFADTAAFPDALIAAQWGLACVYVSPEVWGDLVEQPRTYVLQLMTAHLLALGVIIARGNYSGQPGVVLNSKVGDVQVGLAQPPYGTSPWRYWLMLTPYGQQLLALLDTLAVGGQYVGGLPERAAFRQVGGVFL